MGDHEESQPIHAKIRNSLRSKFTESTMSIDPKKGIDLMDNKHQNDVDSSQIHALRELVKARVAYNEALEQFENLVLNGKSQLRDNLDSAVCNIMSSGNTNLIGQVELNYVLAYAR